MRTGESIGDIADLSAQALYSAEVSHLTRLSHDEQTTAVQAALDGNIEAQHALITHCLNWTVIRAHAIYHEYQPRHTDVMDLVAQANLQMVEKLPQALQANNPVKYLMSTAANEMQRYCYVHDPMIKRSRYVPDEMPETVSLEAGKWSLAERLAGSDITLEAASDDRSIYQFVYDALDKLTDYRRQLLTEHYGLYGQPAKKPKDMATDWGVPTKKIERGLGKAKKMLVRKLGRSGLSGF